MKTTHLGIIILIAGGAAYVAGNKKPQTEKEARLQKIGFVSILLGAGIVMLASRKSSVTV